MLALGVSIELASSSLTNAGEPAVTVGPPVVVTAPRIEDRVADRTIGARVITADEIQRSGASTLPQFLRFSSAIRTRDLPGSPNPLVDLRGFGASFGDSNTLVMLDGARVREYEQLSVNWASIPLASIERIEILPASGGVVYGAGGTGGIVNIVTKASQPNARSGYLGGGLGSYATHEMNAGASLAGDYVSLRLHGSYYETDNYRDNHGVRIQSAQGDVRWTRDVSALALKFGADDQRHGLPSVISEAQVVLNRKAAGTPNDFATQRGNYLNLIGQTRVGSGELSMVTGYRERDTGAAFLAGTPRRNNVSTEVNVWTLAPRLQLRPQLGGWDDDLTIGAEAEDWTFDAVSQPTIPSRPHSTQRSAALYAQHAVSLATRTTLTLGAREQHARYDVIDRARPTSAGERSVTLHAWDISVRQALSPEVSAYAKRGQSFRLPSVNDNFNQLLARVTLLEPQTAREWDLGLEGNSERLSYRVTMYRAELDNEIYFDPVILGSRNRQPTLRKALELDARWQARSFLELHANYIYADATFRSGTVAGTSIAGNRVPLTPQHLLNAGCGWNIAANVRLDFDFRYVGSSLFDLDETNTFRRKIPSYTVTDLKLNVDRAGWLIHAVVRNLFGKKYFSYGVVTGRTTFSAFPDSERSVFMTAQYSFR